MSRAGKRIIRRFPEHSSIHDNDNAMNGLLDNAVGKWFDNMEDYIHLVAEKRKIISCISDEENPDTEEYRLAGEFLDIIGKEYGLYRKDGETNTQFRQRILTRITSDIITQSILINTISTVGCSTDEVKITNNRDCFCVYDKVTGVNTENNDFKPVLSNHIPIRGYVLINIDKDYVDVAILHDVLSNIALHGVYLDIKYNHDPIPNTTAMEPLDFIKLCVYDPINSIPVDGVAVQMGRYGGRTGSDGVLMIREVYDSLYHLSLDKIDLKEYVPHKQRFLDVHRSGQEFRFDLYHITLDGVQFKVLDGVNQWIVPDAIVKLTAHCETFISGLFECITDENGECNLDLVYEGEYDLTITKNDFETYTETITITKENMDFCREIEPMPLDTLTVTVKHSLASWIVPNATVNMGHILRLDIGKHQCTTDKNGQYTLYNIQIGDYDTFIPAPNVDYLNYNKINRITHKTTEITLLLPHNNKYANNGLIAWYDYLFSVLSNNYGISQLNDISGNDNHAVMAGFDVNSWNEKGLYFNSVNTVVTTPIPQNIMNNGMTVDFVMRDELRADNYGVMGDSGSSGNNGILFYRWENATTISAGFYGTADYRVNISINVLPWAFNHVVMTYDGVNTMNVYINGELKATKDIGNIIFRSDNLIIGRALANQNFRGWLRSAMIYDRALSPQEVTQNYEEYLYCGFVNDDPWLLASYNGNYKGKILGLWKDQTCDLNHGIITGDTGNQIAEDGSFVFEGNQWVDTTVNELFFNTRRYFRGCV